MYDRVFVAAGSKAQLQAWEALAKDLVAQLEIPARVISFRDAENCEKTRSEGHDSRDLLIVEAGLPATIDDIGTPGSGGVAYVTRLQTEVQAPPACILVAARFENQLVNTVQNFPRCKLLGVTGDEITSLVAFARALASDTRTEEAPTAAPRDAWALLEVCLSGAQGSYFRLHTSTHGQGEPRPFKPDVQLLRDIVNRSQQFRRELSEKLADAAKWSEYARSWQKEYAELGTQIFRLINQDGFERLWGRALQVAEGNARIRFTLARDAYDGLWESIYDDTEEKWLMLHGGVTRRPHQTSRAEVSLRPIDGGDGTINILAILSDISPGSQLVGPEDAVWRHVDNRLHESAQNRLGRKPTTGDLFPALPNLQREREVLLGLKKVRGRRFSVDVVRSKDVGAGETLFERVRQKLIGQEPPAGSAHRYDIVHFGGHALFDDEADQRGYLIFGDRKITEAVPVAVFADLLRRAGAQLAYLNCCKSSALRAAFELADNNVPLAIGFAWDLETGKAVEFAKSFYGHLLDSDLKVCKAFQLARRDLRNQYQEGDPIWTAAALIAQPERWEKVESCFATA